MGVAGAAHQESNVESSQDPTEFSHVILCMQNMAPDISSFFTCEGQGVLRSESHQAFMSYHVIMLPFALAFLPLASAECASSEELEGLSFLATRAAQAPKAGHVTPSNISDGGPYYDPVQDFIDSWEQNAASEYFVAFAKEATKALIEEIPVIGKIASLVLGVFFGTSKDFSWVRPLVNMMQEKKRFETRKYVCFEMQKRTCFEMQGCLCSFSLWLPVFWVFRSRFPGLFSACCASSSSVMYSSLYVVISSKFVDPVHVLSVIPRSCAVH